MATARRPWQFFNQNFHKDLYFLYQVHGIHKPEWSIGLPVILKQTWLVK